VEYVVLIFSSSQFSHVVRGYLKLEVNVVVILGVGAIHYQMHAVIFALVAIYQIMGPNL
jgi:hypothetical protein